MLFKINQFIIMTKKWYSKGLRFSCVKCGKCCQGFPGYVWLSLEESQNIAQFLGMNVESFFQRFTRLVNGHISLLERPVTYECILLKDNKCQIYPVRPKQCRIFPWWKENLCAKEAWEQSKSYCSGIDKEGGRLYSQEEIDKRLDSI